MNKDLAVTIIMPCLFTAAAHVVWSVSTNVRRARVARAMVDMQMRMLDKLPPGELATYANSEAGRAILRVDAGRAGSPLDRIQNAATLGLVLSFSGLALFMIHYYQVTEEARLFLHGAGSVGIAAGLGLLVSALLSYKLSRNWGVIEEAK